MIKRESKLFKIEKDSNFASRILILSLPSSLVFIMLVALRLLPGNIAVIAYSSIVLFNIVWLFPLTFELQQLKKYIINLSQENQEKLEDLDINLPCPRTSSNGHADSYACGPDHFLWIADYPEAASFNYCPGHQNDWGRCYGTRLIAIRLYRWHSTSSYRGKMTCQKVHNSVEERTLCNKLGLITE